MVSLKGSNLSSYCTIFTRSVSGFCTQVYAYKTEKVCYNGLKKQERSPKMANRRMFNKQIIYRFDFVRMSDSAQKLYQYLIFEADDEIGDVDDVRRKEISSR